MKLPVMAAAVLALLSACANQDGSQQANMSQNKQFPISWFLRANGLG
jgi:type IV pilus biogenesis protein CpaD/CtpE